MAHEDGSTVDVMVTQGDVVLQGDLHIKKIKDRSRKLDLSDDRVSFDGLDAYGWHDEEGWYSPHIVFPDRATVTVTDITGRRAVVGGGKPLTGPDLKRDTLPDLGDVRDVSHARSASRDP